MEMTSRTWSRERIARYGVRVVGLVFGALGVFIVGLAVLRAKPAVREQPSALVAVLLAVALGSYLLWIGRMAVVGFSSRLAKHVSVGPAVLLTGVLDGPLERALGYLTTGLYDLSRFSADLIEGFSKLALLIIIYHVFVRTTCFLTGCGPEKPDGNGRSG